MANNSRRRSNFPARGPHFFKVIHSGIARDSKLMIPTKFVEEHGKDLSNCALLKLPNGAVWQVEMITSNGKVWLHNDGWKQFKEYYSISFGHFLVFRYNGNSQFHVLIFDKCATEIEYPSSTTNGGKAKLSGKFHEPRMERIDMDDSVEILDNFPICQTREIIHYSDQIKVGPSGEKGIPACKGKNTSIPKCWCNMNFPSRGIRSGSTNRVKLENSDKSLGSHGLKQEIKKECNGGMATSNRGLQSKVPYRKTVAPNDKFIAFQRANAFKSKNPYVTVFMQPSYVVHPFILSIPLCFAKAHFPAKKNFALLVSDGRTWPVKCNLGIANAKLCAGWKSFVKDNNLNVGDVCVFEMVKSILPTLKVFIFRAVKVSSKRPSATLENLLKSN